MLSSRVNALLGPLHVSHAWPSVLAAKLVLFLFLLLSILSASADDQQSYFFKAGHCLRETIHSHAAMSYVKLGGHVMQKLI